MLLLKGVSNRFFMDLFLRHHEIDQPPDSSYFKPTAKGFAAIAGLLFQEDTSSIYGTVTGHNIQSPNIHLLLHLSVDIYRFMC